MRMLIILTVCFNINIVNCFASSNNEQYIKDVGECLRQITEREFKLESDEYIIVPNSLNLVEPADKVLDNYLQYVFGKNISVMTIDSDDEDNIWRSYEGIGDQRTLNASFEVDELNDLTEDIFIQSHLTFMSLANYYVVIVDGFRLYNSKIRQLVRKPSWNATAPMIVYCSVMKDSPLAMLKYPKSIMRSLWMYNVMNAVLLIHDFYDNSVINIFSWEPYDPPARCGEKNQDVGKHVKIYNKCISGQLADNTEIFPSKVPRDLKGCPLKVLGVIWHPFVNHNTSDPEPGLDRELLNLIAERINFRVDLNTTIDIWGDRFDNGSWTGMMEALKRGHGEVAIGALYPDNEIHEDFDSTLSYFQDSYIWVVPRAKEIAKWKNFLVILRPTLWLCSVFSYFICTVVWHFMTKPFYETGIVRSNFSLAVLDSLCLQLGVSTDSRPNSHSMRIYFVAFGLYSMIWCTAYQTKLITILTTPIRTHQMTELDELLKSDLKFGGNEAFRDFFDSAHDETEEYLHSNYLEMDIHEVLEHVILYRNLSVLTNKLYISYLSGTTTRYNNKQGERLFYTLHSTVLSFPVEMVTAKGFALRERFNVIITLLKSNGIVKRIISNFNERSKRNTARLARESNVDQADENQTLSMRHLQGAFIIGCFGLLISLIVFVAEIIVQKKINNYRQEHNVDMCETQYEFIQ